MSDGEKESEGGKERGGLCGREGERERGGGGGLCGREGERDVACYCSAIHMLKAWLSPLCTTTLLLLGASLSAAVA